MTPVTLAPPTKRKHVEKVGCSDDESEELYPSKRIRACSTSSTEIRYAIVLLVWSSFTYTAQELINVNIKRGRVHREPRRYRHPREPQELIKAHISRV